MSQTITFRRGTDVERTSVVFNVGEPVFTTDTKQLFIGDGVTAGGVLVGGGIENFNGESFTSISPESGDSRYENALAYYSALQSAKTKRPNGRPLSESNRFLILLYPGIYDFGRFDTTVSLNPVRYVDTIGMAADRSVSLIQLADQGFVLESGHCNIRNVSIYTTGTYVAPRPLYAFSDITGVTFENVNVSGVYDSFGSLSNTSVFDSIKIKDSYFLGPVFANTIGGTAGYVKNSEFTNTTFDFRQHIGAHSFLGSTVGVYSNNKFKNCSFLNTNSLSFYNDSANNYSLDKSNVFDGCYFSGLHEIDEGLFLDGDQAAAQPFEAKLINCIIEEEICSFYGVMQDCIIDGRQKSLNPPLRLNNSPTKPTPAFYNCLIMSSGTKPSVTGLNNSTSGYFSHCAFNNPVATGVTGRFGNQFNVLNQYIK